MNRGTTILTASIFSLIWMGISTAQDIHQAVRQGNLEEVQSILKDNSEWLEKRNSDNLTPLLIASIEGHQTIVEFLIDQGADIHAGDNEGSNALHNASARGNLEIMRILIDKNADINAGDNNGMTALHFASSRGHLSCGELLVQNGADVNALENNGRTPLFFTAGSGNIDFCRLLIENGAKADVYNRFNRSPLTYAIWRNNQEIAELLIDQGAGLNKKDSDGVAPLHLAILEGQTEIAKFLMNRGADAKMKDDAGHLPLHLAAIVGQHEIAGILLQKGTDVNVADAGNDIPLHGAAWNGDLPTVELLMSNGANPRAKNNADKTPLDYAVLSGHHEIAEFLKKRGAIMNGDSNKHPTDASANKGKYLGISGPLKMTVLYDNYPGTEGTRSEWGFACLIEGTEKTILFDTGGDGEAFMHNIKRLNIDLEKVDLIVISHNHWDHIGGLNVVLEKNPKPPVYIPYSFPFDFVRNVESHGGRVIPVKDPVEICENVFLTGQMGTQIKEQSLIVNTTQGSVIVTGCSHQGIVNIVEKTREILDQDIYLVFGGFHLMRYSDAQIQDIVQAFRENDVQKCGATHCTGDRQIVLFKEAFGEHYVPIGTGRVITITDEGMKSEIAQ